MINAEAVERVPTFRMNFGMIERLSEAGGCEWVCPKCPPVREIYSVISIDLHSLPIEILHFSKYLGAHWELALHIPATDRHHQAPLLPARELITPTEPRASVRVVPESRLRGDECPPHSKETLTPCNVK